LLALESTRQRDFPPELAQRLHERAQPFGARLRAAQFRHWHCATFAQDVHVPPPVPDVCGSYGSYGPHGLVRELIAAGRARAATALSGPPGAGRRLAARRVHFEGERAGGPLVACACGALDGDGRASLEVALEEAAEGSLVLLEPERLQRATQAWLLAELEARAGTVRWSATVAGSVAGALRVGRLAPDLGEHLLRLEILVPALAERREEIVAWAVLFAERSARAEGLRAPTFEDAALAVLWRQAWPGNLPELEGLVHKLVLAVRGRSIAPDDLHSLARRFRFPFVARLPSRRPKPADLLAALRTTRHACGSLNKTRAALYLGWDPDTLVARMQGAGIPLDLCFEPA
jgi:DNA-binding NtrC family response regulator